MRARERASERSSHLVQHIRQGTDPIDVPGVIHRSNGASALAAPAQPIADLDDLPLPDHADYFHDLDASGVAADIVPVLLFESARGCWWGARSHCTFCGLNGGAMAFRAKSQGRVLDELQTLTSRWGATMVEAVDNILDMRYFQEFLPAVADADLGCSCSTRSRRTSRGDTSRCSPRPACAASSPASRA